MCAAGHAPGPGIPYTAGMASLLALTWRLLLTAALVLNPVAGAGMAFAMEQAPAKPAASASEMPPCHEMGMAMHMPDAQPAAPHPGDTRNPHEHGCDNAACQFGACCAAGTLDIVVLRLAPLQHDAQALPVHAPEGAAPPPPSRMIRPPIA